MSQPFTALCCDCGTVRTVKSTRHHHGYFDGDPVGERDRAGSYERCIIRRKCKTCAAVTRHAYIREDPSRNFCEEAQARQDARDAASLAASISDLEALGVDVHVTEPGDAVGRICATVWHDLDADRYLVIVQGGRSTALQAAACRKALKFLLQESGDAVWYSQPADERTPALAWVAISTRSDTAAQ